MRNALFGNVIAFPEFSTRNADAAFDAKATQERHGDVSA